MTKYKLVGKRLFASEIVKIPEERIAVLIGKKGEVKKFIQKKLGVRLNIKDETIEITGPAEGVEIATNITKAIGRGFSPERAYNLLKPGWRLEIISIKGESEKCIKRLMGRVIGRAGAARRYIEGATGTLVSVYGSSVAVIGEGEGLETACRVIEALLAGKTHAYAYKELERI
ncbi:MAG: KH domain-containing protein [Candidatus Aenigmatarchaeota archaeon]